MSSLPRPLRAAIGLAATAVDNVRSAPQKALELPMSAVSSALQFSLRAQQRYAELLVRGDEALGHLHGVPDLPPAWATFDEDEVEDSVPPLSVVADVPADVEVELDDIGPDDITDPGSAASDSGPLDGVNGLDTLDGLGAAADVSPALSVVAAAAVVPNPVTAESAPGATHTDAPTKTPAKRSAAKKGAVEQPNAETAVAKKIVVKKAAPKKVTTPRTGKPSAFDAVADPDAF